MMSSAPSRFRRPSFAAVLAVILASPAAGQLPQRIGDSAFAAMMSEMSEPNGVFRSENFLSNETGFQTVLNPLTQIVKPGGAYFGVGPEQNFTYIAALHPAVVFIIDIRHQNAMEHLLYKAVFEMSDNRADFLSRLFSRPRPSGLSNDASADTLFSALGAVAADSNQYYRTWSAIKRQLQQVHHLPLSADELATIEHVFDVFYEAGPNLNYNFGTGGFGGGRGRMPTYAELMTTTDGMSNRSYLANEANYAAVRDLEMRNMIVPLTGDFGGPKAIRAAGDWVRNHHAVVTTFYTSNVEQYLFQSDLWNNFYQNVATLPLDSTSQFIRSGGSRGFSGPGGMRSSLLQPIQELLKAYSQGQIRLYGDVLAMSH